MAGPARHGHELRGAGWRRSAPQASGPALGVAAGKGRAVRAKDGRFCEDQAMRELGEGRTGGDRVGQGVGQAEGGRSSGGGAEGWGAQRRAA